MMLLNETCPSVSLASLAEGVDLLRFELGFLKTLRRELDLNLGDLADRFFSGVFSAPSDSVDKDLVKPISLSDDFKELLSDDLSLSLRDINGEDEGVLIFLKSLKDFLSFEWRDIVAEEV